MKTSDFNISQSRSEASFEYFPMSKMIIWVNFIVIAVLFTTVIF